MSYPTLNDSRVVAGHPAYVGQVPRQPRAQLLEGIEELTGTRVAAGAVPLAQDEVIGVVPRMIVDRVDRERLGFCGAVGAHCWLNYFGV